MHKYKKNLIQSNIQSNKKNHFAHIEIIYEYFETQYNKNFTIIIVKYIQYFYKKIYEK